MTPQPEPVCHVGATLGEGPFWSAREAALWFTDIKQDRLYRFTPKTGELADWTTPAAPGWILPTDAGDFFIGLKAGVHRFSPEDGSFARILSPEPGLPGNRLNDATVDPAGRLWFGSMDDAEEAPTGRVHLFERGSFRTTAIPPVTIVNGPAFSPDGTRLYHVDTLAGLIHVYDVRPDGRLEHPEIFAQIAPEHGYPDGPTVDADGCLWIGLFGGWGVRKYAPDGRLLDYIRFPVANVTKVAFGGADLRTAYATTARKGLDAAALAAQPLAGDLFAFSVTTPGLATPDIITDKDH